MSTADRCRELWESGVAKHSEIARRVGCTREYVRQVLGNRRQAFNPAAALREIRAELERPIVAVLDPMADNERGFLHGTRNGYRYHECGCFWCMEAVREYARQGARERWLAGKHNPTHGRLSTYQVYGCRCAPCTAANAAACRAYQRRRRARSAA